MDLARIPNNRLHDIRHTYVTIARDLDTNQKILSNRVGHANEVVTAQIYTHKTAGQDRELADAVAGLITGKLKEAMKRVLGAAS